MRAQLAQKSRQVAEINSRDLDRVGTEIEGEEEVRRVEVRPFSLRISNLINLVVS